MSRLISTGLRGDAGMEIVESIIGQLSDGMWENYSRYNKYWKCTEVVRDGDDVYLNTWLPGSDSEILMFYAERLKAIVKEWRKDYPDGTYCDYIGYKLHFLPEEVMQAYATMVATAARMEVQ